MKRNLILILFFIISSISFAQTFEIAWGTTYYYSIDRFANDIYYYFTQENKFYKTNITTLEDTATDFPSIPRFANKSHIAVYAQQNNLVLKDFEKDTSFILFTSSQNILNNSYSFSPNDSNIIVFDRYYSFRDNQSHPLNYQISDWDIDYRKWSSDSTILSLETGNVILQYYLYSNKIDTFFSLGNDIFLSGYLYNISNNSLAYSIYSVDDTPKLYLHNFETNNDSILFNPSTDDSSQLGPCWSNPIAIKSITLSPNEKRIGFFNSLLTNSASGLYIFELDSGYANMYLDCSNYGQKYTLEWLSNDTLIYFDATISLIYGIDVRPIIDAVQDFNQIKHHENILISNYPNPFNSTTKIKYSISQSSFVVLKIYDILGNEIETLVNEEQHYGVYEVEYNASNISSGVYFYQLQAGSFISTKKLVLLK